MAQYKVPQDVEADDKLIGPFSFRQFVYLLIAGGLIALAVGLFQIFPLLAIIPVPFILFFGALALPLKKDQPMETYLAAVLSYYLKPHNRVWMPGQRESTITISAPKVVEDDRTRNITGEEATHRLSFLADIVDTQGYAIKRNDENKVQEDLIDEANNMDDMFETGHFDRLESTIARDEIERHEEVVREMRQAIKENESRPMMSEGEVPPKIERFETMVEDETPPASLLPPVENYQQNEPAREDKVKQNAIKSSIMDLANNTEYSVATIAKEANRIKEKEEGEVFISLH